MRQKGRRKTADSPNEADSPSLKDHIPTFHVITERIDCFPWKMETVHHVPIRVRWIPHSNSTDPATAAIDAQNLHKTSIERLKNRFHSRPSVCTVQ
jgi:hypothetical protein